jgi:hypothetical protein
MNKMERRTTSQESDEIANKKRKAVLSKIETMGDDEIQLFYQSLFKEEIMKSFDSLPSPKHKPSDAEIDAAITQKRKQNGFYK